MSEGTKRVFMSHTREDRAFARQLGELLRQRGVSVVFDDVAPGASWSDGLREAIPVARPRWSC